MDHPVSRRAALKQIALAAGISLALPRVRSADAASSLPHVSTAADPTAAALHYVEDASKVDRTKFPTYQPGQMCATCLQLQGTVGDPFRPCKLYPGKLVNAHGWCQVWTKKP